jgi:Glycosyltransferase family 87
MDGAATDRDWQAAVATSAATLKRLGSVALLGVLPAVVVATLFAVAWSDGAAGIDFGQFYYAAEAILRGEDPYAGSTGPEAPWGGEYPYPPLPGLVAMPLTVFSVDTASLLVMATLLVAVLAVPLVLGVTDWRCYGLLLLWPPVISAIQTGNMTIPLALVAAFVWRFRDRTLPSSALVGFTMGLKLFFWPLCIWFAATRRFAAALLGAVFGVVLLGASWAVIGFKGLLEYPDLLRRLDDAVGADSYTLYIVGLDLGLPSSVARGVWLTVGAALLVAVVLVARRGDERSAFMLAIAAALALTPIVWLHYFALLVVVVALAQPRLGVLWALPLGMVVTPGSGHPTPFETAATLAIAAVVIGLALRSSLGMRGRVAKSQRVRVLEGSS